MIQAQTTVLSHDFDATNDGWTLTTMTNGIWSRGADVLNGGSDGTNYWHTSASPAVVDNYSDDAVLVITSATISLLGQTNMILSIDIRYKTEAEYDGFKIEYHDGTSWNDLGSVGDGFNWYNDSDVDGLDDNAHGWSGDNEQWQTAYIGLPVAVENNSTVQFRVRFESDGSTNDAGAAIDNFVITSGGSDILVAGNGIEISNGDETPSELDNTDFRIVDVATGSKLKTFTILNTLGSTLTLTGGSPVTVSGTDFSDFSITQPLDLSLNNGESTTFTVQFDPSSTGQRTAVISIASSDGDENPYTFDIHGFGVTAVTVYNFDADDEGWTLGTNSAGTWLYGTGIFSDGANGSYWHTSPISGYNSLSMLEVVSPVIDLSSGSDFILYMDIRYDTEPEADGWNVEFSDDGGTSWSDLGSVGEGVNWYNDTDVDAISNEVDGWTGDNVIWQTVEIELPVALQGNVDSQFRVVFESDNSENELGVAFDNFMIAVGQPDIYVQGNGIEIHNGETGTSSATGTNFRNVDVALGLKSKVFTISNFGGSTLNLTGGTPVTLTGSSDFTVSSQPASSALTFLEETTFTVQFDPSSVGSKVATVSIANDDPDGNPLTFAIGGTGDNAIVYHDFESSDEGWTVTSSTNGNWVRGSAILSSGADGNFWHTSPSTYSSNAELTIRSSTIDLTGETNLSLTIDLRYDTQADVDGVKVEYSPDDGTSWFDLGMELDGYDWYDNTDVDAFANGEDGWTDDNGNWGTSEIALPTALEDNSTVRFRILFASDATTEDVGVAFDNFAIYGDVTPLPVELIAFTGLVNDNVIDLNWVTGSELNNAHFEVQRSVNGKDFYKIGRVEGKGTTSQTNSYSFTDVDPFSRLNYYRLKQVDYDGNYELHEIIQIDILKFGSHILEASVYPNPSSHMDEVNLKITSEINDIPFIVKVVDMTGVVHAIKTLDNIKKGSLNITSMIPSMPGVYFVFVAQGNHQAVNRIIVY